MKIVNINYSDYANFSYSQTMALKSVGLDAECLTLTSHPFGYISQGYLVSEEEIGRRICEADIVQCFHSHPETIRIVKKYHPKGMITVWHTGTIYRENPISVFNDFNDIDCKIHFTDQCEFLISNEQLKYVPVAIETIGDPKLYDGKNKICFGHFPSKSSVKGTDEIIRMMKSVEGNYSFIYNDQKIFHNDNIKRIEGCDIYIELFKNELGGKPYGSFGVTAFEAAALGKIVVTQNIFPTAYIEPYFCDVPFVISNDEKSFIKNIKLILSQPSENITCLQQKTFDWVRENHSFEATGNRIKKLLGI